MYLVYRRIMYVYVILVISYVFFVFRNRCMYWKHTLFLCLFFWLSQLLHQLCHWAPKSAVVRLLWMIDHEKKLSIRYFGVSVSFKQSHANLIGPKHFDAFCTNSFKILWLMLVFCLFPVAKMCTITPCGSYPHSTNHPWYMSLDFSSVPLLLLGKIGTNIPILLDEYPHIPKKLSRILES